jgi:predicted metalloprotease with PDZ domain
VTHLIHRIRIAAPATHLVEVETRVKWAPGESFVAFMPVWTPGSYLVREYARHVESLSVDAPAVVTKVRKSAWRVDRNGADEVVIRHRLYANELSVRTNHVDETHAFLNAAATLLSIESSDAVTSRLEIEAPDGWRTATPLAREGEWAFEAPDLDTLVDSPLEIGLHREDRFELLGKPHRLVSWPESVLSDGDAQRLTVDIAAILATEAGLFGGALPYDDYLFILHLSARGRGGLEHAKSSALIASPASFATRDAYLDLLSLVAHEAFHLWNVKRIRPAGLTPYAYEHESYTRLLWWFEGATSYYDWRVLRLTRLCSVGKYLQHLADEIAYLDATHGRLVQSLEDASFDAWIKLYRPDENSANSGISYYRKGELVCALLDLEIRARSGGEASLDGVLKHLWDTYGVRNVAVPEGGMLAIFETASGVKLADRFDAWVRAPGNLDYDGTLAHVGLAVEHSARSESASPSLHVRIRNEAGRAIVASVSRGGAAQRAGVDPGDELVAIGGRRLEGANLEAALHGRRAGEVVDLLLTRDGRTHTKAVTLDPPRQDRVRLVAKDSATPEQRAALAAWLGDTHAAWVTT